jgi:hypothetical protein
MSERVPQALVDLEPILALHCTVDVDPEGSAAHLGVPACSVRGGVLTIDEPGGWSVSSASRGEGGS